MPWEMLNKQREGRERKPHSRVTGESHSEGGRAGGTRASFAPRCLRIKRLERHPKPWVTHSTAEETAPGGRVTGSESHGLCAREEPSRSWAAWPQETLWSFLVSGLLFIQPSVRIWPPKPFSPSSTCFLLFFKATPSVALSSLPSLSPQPDTRPRSAHAWLRSGVTSAKRSFLTIRSQMPTYVLPDPVIFLFWNLSLSDCILLSDSPTGR